MTDHRPRPYRGDASGYWPRQLPPPAPAPDQVTAAPARVLPQAPPPVPPSAPPAPSAGSPPPGSGRRRGAGPSPDEPARGSFWTALTRRQREEFLQLAVHRAYPVGTVFWYENDLADHACVLLSGTVEVRVHRDGTDHVIALRGAHELVGERASLETRIRSATVVARDRTEVLRIATPAFHSFIARHPEVLRLLDGQVYRRLTEIARDDIDPTALATVPDEERDAPFPGRFGEEDVTTPDETFRGGWAPDRDRTVRRREHAPRDEPSWADVPTQPHWPSRGRPRPRDLTGDRARPGPRARRSRPAEPEVMIRTIVFVDVHRFGAPYRSDEDQGRIRELLYRIVPAALAESGIAWSECTAEDRGDGIYLLGDPGHSPVRFVAPFAEHLADDLREHNRRAPRQLRTQLRLAASFGPVRTDANGSYCREAIVTSRLVESRALKRQVADTGADLGLIMSDIYHNRVLHTATRDDDPCHRVRVQGKPGEEHLIGWTRLFGGSV